MLMLDIKDTGWWYWLACATLVWVTLLIDPAAYHLLLGVCVTHLLHYIIRERSITSFPVQVRIAYLGYMLLALPEGYQWILWIPAVGTVARVTVGYCVLARTLMLMPFNRQHALSLKFVLHAFLTPPVRGNILHGLPTAP